MVSSPAKPAPARPDGAALRLPAEWPLTNACLLELAALNESLCFERSAEGALVITLPASNFHGIRELLIGAQIASWALANGGYAAPGDAGFALPDSSIRMPDISWVSNERFEAAAIAEEDDSPWALSPDFVLEIRSRSQSAASQQEKMERWMANGVRLGWLLDPFSETVWVYRAGQGGPEQLQRPESLSGEGVMPGLSVDLGEIWR